MDATKLYAKLEEFILPEMSDEWAQYILPVDDLVSGQYRRRSMGVIYDFATEITSVYSAVFPSDRVMSSLIERGVEDSMLFVHHPMDWDIRRDRAFSPISRVLLDAFRERRISVYNLHVPLDHFGPYSTSVSLARALGMEPGEPFAPYFGAFAGVFATVGNGDSPGLSLDEFSSRFTSKVGHATSCYRYGEEETVGDRIAVVAGGGLLVEVLEEIARAGVHTMVTGITVKNEHTSDAHAYAQSHGIDLLGGTHYSTEKFACIAMVDYFASLGLPAEFVDGEPILEDL